MSRAHSVTSPTSQLIFQPFRRVTYVTAHSPTLPSLCLSVSSPTSQLIFQPFRRVTYVTAHSLTLLSLLLRHRLFTYVTWRASHGDLDSNDEFKISGHFTVEQATTASFTEMKKRIAPMPSTS